MPSPFSFGRIGMVARWRPVHLGHAAVLDGMLAAASEVVLGIGSSSCYDLRNPFTAAEVREMLGLVLAGRPGVTIVDVPDLGDPPRWREMVVGLFGPLDAFLSSNPAVAPLMARDYLVLHPARLVPPDRRLRLDATTVRRAMAAGDDWEGMVPAAVARFVRENRLDERFRREFGEATLALDGTGP